MIITEEKLQRKHNNFDLLRLLAACCVFFSHTFAVRRIGKEEWLWQLTDGHYLLSHIGLVIFFSMSGFLVCRSLVTAHSWKQYLVNRFLRIWPAYAVNITLTVLVIGMALTTLPVVDYLSHPQTLIFFFKNISLLGSSFRLPGLFNNTSVNSSIWTIPVEVRLYVLLLILWFIARFRFRQVVAAIFLFVWTGCMIAPAITTYPLITPAMEPSFYLGLFFLAGAGFYLYKDVLPLSWPIWLVLFASWIGLQIWKPSFLHLAELPFFIYSLFWMAMRWPKIPFIKADLSYGIYLYAFPLQLILQYTIGERFSLPVFFLVSGVCVFITAALSWNLIEKKALSRKSTFGKKSSTNAYSVQTGKHQTHTNK